MEREGKIVDFTLFKGNYGIVYTLEEAGRYIVIPGYTEEKADEVVKFFEETGTMKYPYGRFLGNEPEFYEPYFVMKIKLEDSKIWIPELKEDGK